MNQSTDLLLVTVTPVESRAVLDAFQQATGRAAEIQSLDGKTYHDLGTLNGARVHMAISEMGAGGPGASLQAISKAIATLRPSAVIMVGIAFGLDEERQAIGDILVAENLRLYDLQRIGTGMDGMPRIILRGDRPHSSTRLLDACRTAVLHWHGAKVRSGCVLSGEKLVDNLDFRDQLRAFESEAIGGEMEGAGLYTACHDAKVDWLLVKAICDWADGHKGHDKDARQAFAANNAAGFLAHLIGLVKLKLNPAEPGTPNKATATQSAAEIHATGNHNAIATDGSTAIVIGGSVVGSNIIVGHGNSVATDQRGDSNPKPND